MTEQQAANLTPDQPIIIRKKGRVHPATFLRHLGKGLLLSECRMTVRVVTLAEADLPPTPINTPEAS